MGVSPGMAPGQQNIAGAPGMPPGQQGPPPAMTGFPGMGTTFSGTTVPGAAQGGVPGGAGM
jgi:hypothetical protein